MCGIVGVLGKGPVAELLVDALKRLEYRGYDSAGVATLENGRIERRRAEGKLRNLEQLLKVGLDDLGFRRNRVRHRVMPELERVASGAADNIARAAELLQGLEDWLQEVATEKRRALELDESFPGGRALALDGLRALASPVAAAVVMQACREVRGDLRGLSRDHVEMILDLVADPELVAADLPGLRARREGGALRLLPLVGRDLAVPGLSDRAS